MAGRRGLFSFYSKWRRDHGQSDNARYFPLRINRRNRALAINGTSEVYTVYMPARIPTARRITAAARRILDQQGAEAVTMRRIAKVVGITPMALYRHFPDRAGLLNALADAGFEELAASLAQAPRSGDVEERLMHILEIYLDFSLQKPKLFELMFLHLREGARRFPPEFRAGHSPTANFAAALFEEGMNDGTFRRDDPWEITFETGALLQGLVMLYVGGRVDLSAVEFRALCHRSMRRYIHGIRNEKGRSR